MSHKQAKKLRAAPDREARLGREEMKQRLKREKRIREIVAEMRENLIKDLTWTGP